MASPYPSQRDSFGTAVGDQHQRIGDLEANAPPVIYQIKVFRDVDTVTAGDGAMIFAAPPDLNGLRLIEAGAWVTTASSSGSPTIQIRNISQSLDYLSTEITIDAGEYTSYTATTLPLVGSTAPAQTGDLISIDVDGAGSGAKGLGVTLRFG